MLNHFIELNNAIFGNGLASGSDIIASKANLELVLSSCNGSANGKNPFTPNNTLIKCGDNDKEPESINVLESTEELLKNLIVAFTRRICILEKENDSYGEL